jgi:hypothetical protein
MRNPSANAREPQYTKARGPTGWIRIGSPKNVTRKDFRTAGKPAFQSALTLVAPQSEKTGAGWNIVVWRLRLIALVAVSRESPCVFRGGHSHAFCRKMARNGHWFPSRGSSLGYKADQCMFLCPFRSSSALSFSSSESKACQRSRNAPRGVRAGTLRQIRSRNSEIRVSAFVKSRGKPDLAMERCGGPIGVTASCQTPAKVRAGHSAVRQAFRKLNERLEVEGWTESSRGASVH